MVRVKVLRSTHVAANADGSVARPIVAGTEDEIPDNALEGLMKEGYVKALPADLLSGKGAGPKK